MQTWEVKIAATGKWLAHSKYFVEAESEDLAKEIAQDFFEEDFYSGELDIDYGFLDHGTIFTNIKEQ